MDGWGTLAYASGLLITSTGLAAAFGLPVGFATFVVGGVAAPVGFAVVEARRLLRQGFAHADLAPAFRAELENAREERAVGRSGGRLLERLASRLARIAGSFSGIAIPAIVAGLAFPATRVIASSAIPATVATVIVGIVAGTTYLAMLQARRDVDTEFWSAMWMGRVGTIAFAAARRLRGAVPTGAAMTHRATELSLGLAAEQLYESLPKATRQALGNLPASLERLQHAAQMLRRRYDDLNAALEMQRPGDASAEVESLQEERTVVHDKLTGAVGALETIRLNLLRLHAGSVVVEGLTTHLGIAEEVSAEIERMISARDDIDATLRFPRPLESTPA
jgi:serine/threonine-protein kinase